MVCHMREMLRACVRACDGKREARFQPTPAAEQRPTIACPYVSCPCGLYRHVKRMADDWNEQVNARHLAMQLCSYVLNPEEQKDVASAHLLLVEANRVIVTKVHQFALLIDLNVEQKVAKVRV